MNIHIKSILAAIAFSLLFYSKSLGLNLFLISILAVVLVSTLHTSKKRSWWYSSIYVFTALLVFLNPTGFTIFVNFMSFTVFVIAKNAMALKQPAASIINHSSGRISTIRSRPRRNQPRVVSVINPVEL